MKILHIIYRLCLSAGGPPRGLANLARAQARRGDDVVVLPAQASSGEQTLPVGCEGSLTVLEAPTKARLLWYNHAVRGAIRKAARDRDIVHIHGTWRYYLLAAAGAAEEYGVPYIIRPAGSLGRIPRSQKRIVKAPYFALLERPAFNRAAAIQCCSQKEYEELMDLGLSVRAFIVPQPIRSELLTMRPAFDRLQTCCPRLTDHHKVILYLGRISPIKRLPILVEAFGRLSGEFPDWRLLVTGPNEDLHLTEALQRQVAAAGLEDRVFFPGQVSNELKAACYVRADIFAQPSSHENFGMSTAEALLLGLPCVVSNGVALARDIETAGAGLVTDSRVDSFSRALRELMSSDARRTQLSKAATRLGSRFHASDVAAELDLEYRRCLEERQQGVPEEGIQPRPVSSRRFGEAP